MNKTTCGLVITRLEVKYAAKGKDFTAAMKENYSRQLGGYEDSLVLRAVSDLCVEREWAPDDGAIIQRIVEIASPTPESYDAWRNCWDRAGVRNTEAPIHRLVDDAAEALGGLGMIWHLEHYARTPLSILSAQYINAYEGLRARWRSDVREALRLTEPERNSLLFPVAPMQMFAAPWGNARTSDVKKITIAQKKSERVQTNVNISGIVDRIGRTMPRIETKKG